MGTPANFVIIGYTDQSGRVMMTALSNVCKVEINESNGYDELHSWGGQVSRSILRDHNVMFTAESRREDVTQVEAGDHASAWRKLFDLWVPPTAVQRVDRIDKDSQDAINAHFTFNPPTPQPAKRRHFPSPAAGGGGGGGIAAWSADF